jgi:hypothetical protein
MAVAVFFFGIGSAAGAADPVPVIPLNGPVGQPATTPVPCPDDSSCPTRPRVWATAEYFYGVGQGTIVPPLVTSAPAGTAPGQAGAVGFPQTTILFGGRRELNEFRPGFRVEVGAWLDRRDVGMDFSYWQLGNSHIEFRGTQPNPAGPQLFVPQTLSFGPNVGLPVGVPVGLSPNWIAASAGTAVYGTDGNGRWNLTNDGGLIVDFLVGSRYVRLSDDATQTATYVVTNPFTHLNQTLLSDSVFLTRNIYYGGQVGLAVSRTFASGFSVEWVGKCAIGLTHSQGDVVGSTSFVGTPPSASGSFASSSLLIQSGVNDGRYVRDYFGWMPESTLKVGYNLTDRIRITGGYSFLYWSKVQRAADQISLNTVQAPYPAATTDYWVQGWTAGVEIRF